MVAMFLPPIQTAVLTIDIKYAGPGYSACCDTDKGSFAACPKEAQRVGIAGGREMSTRTGRNLVGVDREAGKALGGDCEGVIEWLHHLPPLAAAPRQRWQRV